MGHLDRIDTAFLLRWLRVGLFVTFTILAIGYSVAIPPGEAVDEVSHMEYVRFVKENWRLPVQPMRREDGVQVWMGHHPPLYYALGALVISPIDTSDFTNVLRPNQHFVWAENDGSNGWNRMMHFGQEAFPWSGSILALHVLRLLSVAMGVLAVYAMYRAASLLFTEQPWAPLGATALVAFNPSFIFMSSTIHHDVLLTLLFALCIWLMVRRFRGIEGRWDGVAMGLLVGFAMLTKLSGLVLAGAVAAGLCLLALRDHDWRWLLRQMALTFAVTAVIAGWWYVRNWRLYGDPLGWQMFLNLYSPVVRTGPYTWYLFTHEFLSQLGRTYWGAFGYMHITFPEVTRYLWGLAGLAAIGLAFGVARRHYPRHHRQAEWAFLLLVLALLVVSFIRYSITIAGGGHGRYLLPASSTLAVLMLAGFNGFTGWRHQRGIALVLCLGMAVYAVWLPAKLLLPKYEPPETVPVAELSQEMQGKEIRVASGLELAGYRLGAEHLAPGSYLPVTLYWKATGDPSSRADPRIRLELIDQQDKAVASYTAWPVPSLSPDVWADNSAYVSRAILALPPALPSKLRLAIVPLLKSESGTEGASEKSGDRVIITDIATSGGASEASLQDIAHPRHEVFASTIGLAGYGVSTESIAPGDVLSVDLFWNVLEKPAADYTVFVHLLNGKGELVTQFDRPAGGEAAPSSTWNAGQLLRDTYPLLIPAAMPSGEYKIVVGMYTWPAIEHVPVSVDGNAAGDAVELGTISVVR